MSGILRGEIWGLSFAATHSENVDFNGVGENMFFTAVSTSRNFALLFLWFSGLTVIETKTRCAPGVRIISSLTSLTLSKKCAMLDSSHRKSFDPAEIIWFGMNPMNAYD